MIAKLAAVLVTTLATSAAAGHDLWLQPSSFRPPTDTPLAVRLMVGDDFKGDPVARNDARIDQFIIRDADGARTITGPRGGDPAGVIDSVHGPAVIGYRTRQVRHGDMPPQRFESYLREEGLDLIISERKRSGASARPGREIYSRSAKAYIGAGGAYNEPFGFRFEIVPEDDPSPATNLRVRLLFEGGPVEGILVTAIHESARPAITRRSDAEGRVSVPIGTDGVWLIKAVHMITAPESSGAEWESIWATVTFERRRQ